MTSPPISNLFFLVIRVFIIASHISIKMRSTTDSIDRTDDQFVTLDCLTQSIHLQQKSLLL